MRSSLLICAAALLIGATPPAKPQTPGDVLSAAPASAWRDIAADDLLVLDLRAGGRVVIQLAPAFAPVHVANIKALARTDFWRGAAIYRVHDNFVTQWGNNDAEKPWPAGVVANPPAEYTRPLKGLTPRPLGFADPFAPGAGYALGWPIAYSPKAGWANLAHCYGSVGAGRGLTDTGAGGELYAVIGHAPRALDRNIAVVGRVVEGIELLSALPRGTEALGFYKERSMDVPIATIRLASEMPAAERPAFQFLDEQSKAFADYLRVKANRKDDFYVQPAGGVDLCAAAPPLRRKP
jgi:peptidylprolyl isomerase